MADPPAMAHQNLPVQIKLTHMAENDLQVTAIAGDLARLLDLNVVDHLNRPMLHIKLDKDQTTGYIPKAKCLVAHRYPFINTTGHQYTDDEQVPPMVMKPGDYGEVLELEASGATLDWAVIHFPRRRISKGADQGRAPLSWIKIGTSRKFGDVVEKVDAVKTPGQAGAGGAGGARPEDGGEEGAAAPGDEMQEQ